MSTQTLIEHGPFIAGVAEPLSGEHREITNPGTGELVGRVTAATAQDADRAVNAAQDAFKDWSRRGYADRGRIIHACAEAFEAHVDELVPILVAEQGKTIREAKIELHKAADTLEHYAGLSRQVRGISVHNIDPGVDARVLRRPLGVVAAIVPWNFPTTLLCNKLGPAFLTGNTVVAKPADTTPLTTLRLAEIFHEAGLPAGVFNVLPGKGSVAGDALVRHPLVRKVAFTGSTPIGEQVAALAAVGSKRVTLELGGSDPMIICDDADLKAAASAAAMGRFYNCGQACLAIKRLYVFESVADEVVAAVAAKAARLRVGIGSDPDSQLGPLHTEGQREELERQIAESGGEILAGGGRPEGLDSGWFHEPTVVLEPGRDSPMATRGGLRSGAADLAREGHGRGDRAGQQLAVRPRLERVDAGPRPRRARRLRARLRLHVDQLAHEGLRRAALRRPQGLRLRQGARLRGAGLLHRSEVGRRQALAVASLGMDADSLVAIDVHSHVQASLTSRGFPPGSPEAAVAEVFGSDKLLNVPELAAFYRERKMAAVCFMVDTVRWGGPVTNDEILELAAKERDALIPFVSIDPHRGAEGVAKRGG